MIVKWRNGATVQFSLWLPLAVTLSDEVYIDTAPVYHIPRRLVETVVRLVQTVLPPSTPNPLQYYSTVRRC